MARTSQFQFDVFLSYGWADITSPNDGDRGWVADFKKQLQIHLEGELGRRVEIFHDVEQPLNGALVDNLSTAIRSSAVFLGVVTPGSCKPESWCHKEIREFFDNSANILPSRRQVFVVRLRDVDPPKWPEPLRTIASYDFLTDNPPRFPLPRQHIEDTSTVCGKRLQELAHDVATALQDVEVTIQQTLYCGFVSEAREALLKRLSNESIARGGSVVRGSYVPGEAESAFMARTANELRRCGLSVHLTESAAPHPEGWSDSIDNLQIRAAKARFGDEKNRVVVWQDSLSAADVPAEALGIAQVLKGTGFEYLDSLLSDLFRKHSEPASPIALTTHDKPFIYVECVPTDVTKLQALRDSFEARGVQMRAPLFLGEEGKRKQFNGLFVQRCNGAAVYFGDRNELEACVACQDILDMLGARKDSVPRAVLLDPFPDPVRRGFLYPDFENYALTNLDDFVRQILADHA